VTRGRLGAWIQDLNQDLASSFGYDSRDGVLIGDVDPASPAGKAGLRSGDIVLKYDGEPVKKADDLRMRVANTKPGDKVDLEVYRDGKTKTIDVTIGELEAEDVAENHPGGAQTDQGAGMTVRTLTPDIAQQLGLDGDVKGAVVTDVEAFGPAADAGIRQGDVIVQVQNAPVKSAEELRRELGKQDLEKGVRVIVLSGGSRRFAMIKSKSH
jgi:serine protease Do